ncbi:hypothetical protein CRE_26849 [Caenorhabditis remanei]|uniref:Uncharacterized protein n=1 Tax=Caenorhabditis remanei TaxID=31234 RepID=E3NLH0_CAERE|nr:hypothetical protein CRE_26849 [Caenorhabditis remanei]
MLRALRGAADLLSTALVKRNGEMAARRFLSTPTPEAVAAAETALKSATDVNTETAEVVTSSEDSGEPSAKVQRLTQPYSQEAITKLKLDQYPLYVEREWWKTGKRMTFWASWRQLRDVKRREQIQVSVYIL